MQIFFFFWGGGGNIRCIMGNVQVAYGPQPMTLMSSR